MSEAALLDDAPPVQTVQKFWSDEEPTLGLKGEIVRGGMFEHQRKWWQLPNFVKALVAGYGAGKTFIGAKRDISQCLLNAPAPQLVVSPTYKIAKRTIVPTIIALCEGKKSLRQGFSYDFNKSEMEFTIRDRDRVGTIWCASGEDSNSLKGPNIGSGHIDEPFIQDREVLDQMMARIRDPRAKRKELILTGTPEQLNWGYDICSGEEKEDYDVGVVHASTRANTALGGDSYAKRMERAYDERAARAFVGGEFVNLSSGVVYYGFSDDNVMALPDPGFDLEVGMDFNVDPMAAVVFWRNGSHVHIVREYELPNADTEYMCSQLKEMVFTSGPRTGMSRVLNVYPDASGAARHTSAPAGRSDFFYIRAAGFTLQAASANPKIRDRENAVNGKLRPSYGSPTLTIDPGCKRLIKYMRTYTHENKNKQKSMSHLLDALGYPIAYLFPVARMRVNVTKFQGA